MLVHRVKVEVPGKERHLIGVQTKSNQDAGRVAQAMVHISAAGVHSTITEGRWAVARVDEKDFEPSMLNLYIGMTLGAGARVEAVTTEIDMHPAEVQQYIGETGVSKLLGVDPASIAQAAIPTEAA